MDIRVSLDGAAGMLLLSLPWLLLAVAAWRSSKVNGRTRRGQGGTSGASYARQSSGTLPSAQRFDPGASGENALGIMSMAPPDLSGEELGSVHRDADFAAEPDAPVLSAKEQEEALLLAVEAAKAERDDGALSRNSVLLARLLIARSARPEAAALLQSAALVARRAKLPHVHAEARIELADLARLDGDMTSACEHWQMAKLMFHETGRRADQDRMAELMRHNRCPTDWILTNF